MSLWHAPNDNMVAPSLIPAAKYHYNTKQFTRQDHYWVEKMRESMSSLPSAVHFGHYMAGTFNPTIVVFNACLANLGFTTGYSLKRWRTRLKVMLEKQPGNFNVKKLRISLLFKGDFNNNNKWLG